MINAEQDEGPQPKTPNYCLRVVVGISLILSIAGIGVITYLCLHGSSSVGDNEQPASESSSEPTEQSADYDVVVKENQNDETITDVYLKDPNTGRETLFITLSDVYRGHYHNAEYHNGNLYIIHRTGGDSGYETNPDWMDELWRYSQQKQGQKLHSARGLDFRVSDNEGIIAIVTNEEFNLLDNDGNEIKVFQHDEVVADPQDNQMFDFLAWGPNSVWLNNTSNANLVGLTKIDTATYTVVKYDLSELPVGSEYAINAYSEVLAFSNYPAMFDIDSVQEYEQSAAEVNLMVYDLNTKMQQQVATSIAKRFEPEWTDENTLEYTDPNSAERMTIQVP